MQNKKEQRAKNLEMIGQWQQSGLTQRAFCATHNIAYHVFHYYYGVYSMRITDLNKTKCHFFNISLTCWKLCKMISLNYDLA
jgi:hypothetical protein